MDWDFLVLCLYACPSFNSLAHPGRARFMTFEQEKGEEGHLRGFHSFLSSAPFEVLLHMVA